MIGMFLGEVHDHSLPLKFKKNYPSLNTVFRLICFCQAMRFTHKSTIVGGFNRCGQNCSSKMDHFPLICQCKPSRTICSSKMGILQTKILEFRCLANLAVLILDTMRLSTNQKSKAFDGEGWKIWMKLEVFGHYFEGCFIVLMVGARKIYMDSFDFCMWGVHQNYI